MTTKQQLATGFLALIIVGSIALMPVNAEVKAPQATPATPSGNIVVKLNTPELSQDRTTDLTYN
jgi:hypothetical protein